MYSAYASTTSPPSDPEGNGDGGLLVVMRSGHNAIEGF